MTSQIAITGARVELEDRSPDNWLMPVSRCAFMVSAAEAKDRINEHRTFARAAGDAGVEHLVYLSFGGASATSIFTLRRDHFATEQFIRELGEEIAMAHTFPQRNDRRRRGG